MRMSTSDQHTRAVFELSSSLDYKLFQLKNPDRVVLDFDDARLASGFQSPGANGLLKDVRTGKHGKHGVRVVLDMKAGVQVKSFLLDPAGGNSHRLVLDLYPSSDAGRAIVRRTAPVGERKVLIAIDPGHGGKDSGAHGRGGLEEKTVTLAIAKRLAALVNKQPGMKAILTRDDDTYIPLERRFEIARQHKADMFVSIHANSCPNHCSARGASVWVLSTHGKESEAGKWLARSENASDLIGVSLDNRSHTLASVLLDLSQGASMQASKQVGHDVLGALKGIIPLYKPSVQHANFVVLRSPDVPSILVETAFISNRHDERLLRSSSYRQKMADAILKGLDRYFTTTPPQGTWFAAQWAKKHGMQIASTTDATASVDAPSRADANVQDLHKVSSGETLSGIAHQYGVSMDAIKNANNLDGNMVRAGSMLAIPAG
ncbi:N-acetylmuramoyl-L-alanine amidase [Oleiagrimonas soli]|nr:N-acetylmuramoyl-L-alanine amidase [Oleiagrimonas soli]MBB6183722.1 N-acetylmuramoyl-L-alanine amidase [Oleiagrimonas soli]